MFFLVVVLTLTMVACRAGPGGRADGGFTVTAMVLGLVSDYSAWLLTLDERGNPSIAGTHKVASAPAHPAAYLVIGPPRSHTSRVRSPGSRTDSSMTRMDDHSL
jgi:hypothetical protein